MSGISELDDSPSSASLPLEASAAQVHQTLAALLESQHFRSSKQSQKLLRFLVEQTLAGAGPLLKERIIGVEVFGRDPDYDTTSDPIVRARVAELRKRLAQFFIGEGAQCPVRIEINPGGYSASFNLQESPLAAAAIPTSGNAIPPESNPDPLKNNYNSSTVRLAKHLYIPIGITVLVLLCLVAGFAWKARHQSDPLLRFWTPVLNTHKPVLIYTGSNPVYLPSDSLLARYRATHSLDELEAQGNEYLVPLTPEQRFSASDLVAIRSTFVTHGDVAANVAVASLLTRQQKSFDLRTGEDVSFGDLRQSPVVLIGGFNNRWTMQLTGDLQFILSHPHLILDRLHPERHWTVRRTPDGKLLDDYALIVRLPHLQAGEPLVVIAGLTESGTRAAAEFITSQKSMQEIDRTAPRGWENMNVELVLHTRTLNDLPTSPTIVAMACW